MDVPLECVTDSCEGEVVVLETSDYLFCDGSHRKEFIFEDSSSPQYVSLTPIPIIRNENGNSVEASIRWEARGYSGELSVTRQPGVRGECHPNPQAESTTFDGRVFDSISQFGYTNIIKNDYLKVQSHQFDCGGGKSCSDALVVFYKTDKFIITTTNGENKFRIVGRASIIKEGTDFTNNKYTLDFMTISVSSGEIMIVGVDGASFLQATINIGNHGGFDIIQIPSIILSGNFRQSVSGLCGNFDGNGDNDASTDLSVPAEENYFHICKAGDFINTNSLLGIDAESLDHNLCSISYVLHECPGLRVASILSLYR